MKFYDEIWLLYSHDIFMHNSFVHLPNGGIEWNVSQSTKNPPVCTAPNANKRFDR